MENFNERIAKLEADDKNIFHQLDEIKTEVRDIRRLTVAVEKVAAQTENTAKKVDDISNRLGDVERAPSEEFKHYKRALITALVTGTVGTVLGAVFAQILK